MELIGQCKSCRGYFQESCCRSNMRNLDNDMCPRCKEHTGGREDRELCEECKGTGKNDDGFIPSEEEKEAAKKEGFDETHKPY